MDELKEILKSQNFNEKVSDNFDEIVFSKIRKKELFKKKLYSVIMIILILSAFFGLPFLKHNMSNLVKSKHKNIKKTDVPVVENMNFASSDNINNYAIEIIPKDKKSRRPL